MSAAEVHNATGKTALVTGAIRGIVCQHQPRCPRWQAPDHLAARIVADQSGQGWSLLCNGVIVFDDGGELLPDGHALAPGRPVLAEPLHLAA